jgi:hypothetical protein
MSDITFARSVTSGGTRLGALGRVATRQPHHQPLSRSAPASRRPPRSPARRDASPVLRPCPLAHLQVRSSAAPTVARPLAWSAADTNSIQRAHGRRFDRNASAIPPLRTMESSVAQPSPIAGQALTARNCCFQPMRCHRSTSAGTALEVISATGSCARETSLLAAGFLRQQKKCTYLFQILLIHFLLVAFLLPFSAKVLPLHRRSEQKCSPEL